MSLAFPLIGAGSGGASPERVQAWIQGECTHTTFSGSTLRVRYSQ